MNHLNSTNSDNSDQGIEMLTKPWEWIGDMFYAGLELIGSVILLAVAISGFAYGLHRAGWL